MNASRTPTHRLAFTLVEVLVVLALLAIATTMAVQSLGPIAAQAHQEVTLRTLESVKNSVVSTTGSTVAGFLVDTGRLPLSTDELTGIDSTSGQSFVPSGLTTFTNASFNMTTSSGAQMTITLPTGWNGSYVQPGVGMTRIVDGWGQPLALTPTVPVVISNVSPSNLNPINPVSVTVPLSSLQASSVTVQFVDASGNPKSIPGTIAWFGAGPAGSSLASFSTFASVNDSNIHTYNVPIPAGNGVINVSTLNLQPTAQSPSVASVQLYPTSMDGTQVPLIGPRMFCVLTSGSSGGTQISYGPVYQVIRPGSNTVLLPPAPSSS